MRPPALPPCATNVRQSLHCHGSITISATHSQCGVSISTTSGSSWAINWLHTHHVAAHGAGANRLSINQAAILATSTIFASIAVLHNTGATRINRYTARLATSDATHVAGGASRRRSTIAVHAICVVCDGNAVVTFAGKASRTIGFAATAQQRLGHIKCADHTATGRDHRNEDRARTHTRRQGELMSNNARHGANASTRSAHQRKQEDLIEYAICISGTMRKINNQGFTIGRQTDCDFILSDLQISRKHLHLRPMSTGVEAIPLGRVAPLANGIPFTKPTLLQAGAQLTLPGFAATIERFNRSTPTRIVAAFLLEHVASQTEGAIGARFGLTTQTFTLGCHPSNDLIVPAWPLTAIRLHLPANEPHIEALTTGVKICNQRIEKGEICLLDPDTSFSLAGEQFALRQPSCAVTTLAVASLVLPRKVVVELLPRGGRVVFTMLDNSVHELLLADRRLDLIITLLQPAIERVDGYVDDEVLRSRVWPRTPWISRQEINMLISRCRRDLVNAGLAGGRLLERAPGGGGTRLLLAANAEVEVC